LREFIRFLKCVLWHRGHEFEWIRKWAEQPDIIVKTCNRCGHEPEVTVMRQVKATVSIVQEVV